MKKLLTALSIFFISFAFANAQMQDLTNEEEEEEKSEKTEEVEEEKETEGFQDLSAPEEEFIIQTTEDGLIPQPQTHDEAMKYYKDKFYAEFDAYFEDVWNAVIDALKSEGCELITKVQKQNDEGFYKGVFKSEFCVFVNGEDKSLDQLRIFSLKMPIIRGGVWMNGRVQYKIIIEEIDEGEKTSLFLKAELSGSEENVTNEVHFWESNGWFETNMMQRIKNNLQTEG